VSPAQAPALSGIRQRLRKVAAAVSFPSFRKALPSTGRLELPIQERDFERGLHSHLRKAVPRPDGRTKSADAEYLTSYLRQTDEQPAPLPLPHNIDQFIKFHESSWPSRLAVESIKNEVFRLPLAIKPAWAAKCPKCGTEFDHAPTIEIAPVPSPMPMGGGLPSVGAPPPQKPLTIEACPECYSATKEIVTPRAPDKAQKYRLTKLLKSIDKGGRTLKSMMMALEEDVLVADIQWTLMSKDYSRHPALPVYVLPSDKDNPVLPPQMRQDPFSSETSLLPKVTETFRGNPMALRFVVDDKDRLGGRFWTCVIHRQYLFDLWRPQSFAKGWSPRDGYGSSNGLVVIDNWARIPAREDAQVQAQIAKGCPQCGCRLEEVLVVAVDLNRSNLGEVPVFGYIAGEFIAVNRFSTAYRYGRPLLLATWIPLSILKFADRHVHRLLRDGLPPKGILAIPGTNEDSVKAWFEKEYNKGVTNRGHIPTMLYDPGEGSSKPEFVSITPTMEELEFTASVEFYLLKFCAIYGVSPPFLNDPSSGGGLNNDGMMLYVTLRTIEKAHANWHEDWMPHFLSAHHITDWDLEFEPPKEEDRVAVIDRRLKQVQLLQMLLPLLSDDATIEVRDKDELDWTFSGTIDPKKASGASSVGGLGAPGAGAALGGDAGALGGVKDNAAGLTAKSRIIRPPTGAEALAMIKGLEVRA